MTSKRLETIGGFRTFERSELVSGSRAVIRAYLEARGFAVYSDEKLSDLRASALEDFDSEKGT